MKLNTILKEDGAMLTFNHLNSKQIYLLRKMDHDLFNLDDASPADWATLSSLQDLGLVDDEYELTPTGKRGAEIGHKVGSQDRQDAAKTDAMLGRTGGQAQRYTDTGEDEEVQDDEPGAFQNRWQDIKDRDD